MLLKERATGQSVEIVDLGQLFSLFENDVLGRYQVSNKKESVRNFEKKALIFSSGEELPRCWLDPHYRDDDLKR